MSYLDCMGHEEALEILGLNQSCSQEDIRRAYREWSKICHPDAKGTNGLFQLLSKAYDVVKQHETKKTSFFGMRSRKTFTYDEIIHDPHFCVPFPAFMAIATHGMAKPVVIGDNQIYLSSEALKNDFIKTSACCRMRIRTWKSRFHRMMCLKSAPEVVREFELTNMFPQTDHLFAEVALLYKKSGYHEVHVEIPGQTVKFFVQVKRSCEPTVVTQEFRVPGVVPISFSIKVSFVESKRESIVA